MNSIPNDDDYDSNEDEDYQPSESDHSDNEALLINKDVSQKSKTLTKAEVEEIEKDWDDFLSQDAPKKVEPEPTKPEVAVDSSSSPAKKPQPTEEKPTCSGSEPEQSDRKRKIVETFDFCGEEVTREYEVDEKTAAQIEAKRARQEVAKKTPRTVAVSGLDAILKKNADKKKNMTVFEKTGMDWNKYVKTDEKLETSLNQYGKSTANVLDKMNFIKE